jgi:hypothetical protein
MRVISEQTEKRLNRLLELAGGDLELLKDALTKAAPEKEAPDLDDIIEYILEHNYD